MIISIGAKKPFDEIQHIFVRKTLKELGTEENFLNIV